MDPYEQNPAGRAYKFLSYSKITGNPNTSIHEVWGSYFEVEDTASIRVMAPVLDLITQVGRIEEMLETTPQPLPPDFYKAELDRTKNAFFFGLSNIHNQIEQFRGQFDPGTLAVLQACSHLLNSAGAAEVQTDPEIIKDASTAATELLAAIQSDSSLDPRVALVLIQHVTEIIRLISQARVLGFDAVVHEFDALRAHITRSPELVAVVTTSPSLRERLGKLAVVVSAAITLIHAPNAVLGDLESYREVLWPSLSSSMILAPAETVDLETLES